MHEKKWRHDSSSSTHSISIISIVFTGERDIMPTRRDHKQDEARQTKPYERLFRRFVSSTFNSLLRELMPILIYSN